MFRRFLEESLTKQAEKHGSNEDEFCVIRWEDRSGFDIVHLQDIRASPKSIVVYETYTVEVNGKQRKGTVILKGTKRDCQRLQYNVAPKTKTTASSTTAPKSTKSETQECHTASSSASDILADVEEESSHTL